MKLTTGKRIIMNGSYFYHNMKKIMHQRNPYQEELYCLSPFYCLLNKQLLLQQPPL